VSGAKQIAHPAPAAYAAFAPILERLSEPLRRVLCGQLEQFERLAPNLDAPELAPQGEFEGLGGLTLRGDINHILQSELLLRSEAPLEFLRRLVEAETLYSEKQYADTGARLVYRAILSVGPGALGHGRVVGLAALFFLARIAHARRADFYWCFLPRTDGAVWFEALSVNTVKRLLRSASYREMNGQDVDEALAFWSSPARGARAADERDVVDWMIGARPRRPVAVRNNDRTGYVVDTFANALAFAVLPPRPGEPRAAELRLREGGRELARTLTVFPADAVCASALVTPFQPLVPPKFAVRPPVHRRGQAGWAPQFFATSSGNGKIIRMSGGLLILAKNRALEIEGRWFVPLAPDILLAGVRLHGDRLGIVIHTTRSSNGALIYGDFRLPPSGDASLASMRVARIPAAQLFRQQPAFAVPPLTFIDGVQFYSATGQTFQLGFGSQATEASFTPLYKAPKVLAVTGAYHVMSTQTDGDQVLRVLRNGASLPDDFYPGAESIAADRLLGMVYNRSSRSLAYSVSPETWTVLTCRQPSIQGGPPGPQAPPPGRLAVDRHESVLAGQLKAGVLSAQIWSDARYGGDGTVRTIRRRDGGATVKQPILKLGDDALTIGRIEVGDEGVIWAITLNESGEPAELLGYRALKANNRFLCTRFDLEALVREATTVDLRPLHD
jgi:hypothetical protein